MRPFLFLCSLSFLSNLSITCFVQGLWLCASKPFNVLYRISSGTLPLCLSLS